MMRRWLVLAGILTAAGGFLLLPSRPVTALAQAPPRMVAHFIDVGQADSTLLEFPCGAILIDAGAQDEPSVALLTDYLDQFFAGRPDLDKTLDLVMITHNHIDHTRGLRQVAERYKVKRYIDNGQLGGTGTGDPRWVRTNATTGGRNITLAELADTLIPLAPPRLGLTNATIDPVVCPTCDPKIHVLSGRLEANPDWAEDEFENKNNHSLVTRVDFGESSFLITGDLEGPGIERLVERYSAGTTLDVDVYHVGHHGSHNATTADLLEAMTPELAVISMGKWDYGLNPFVRFSTHRYGHPRRSTVDLLRVAIRGRRPQPKEVMIADGVANFRPFQMRNKIYATGWDGTVKVSADLTGVLQISHN